MEKVTGECSKRMGEGAVTAAQTKKKRGGEEYLYGTAVQYIIKQEGRGEEGGAGRDEGLKE